MLRVLDCVVHRHDLRLVALSALICVLGCLTTTLFMARALEAGRRASTGWLVCAAAVFGSSIWSLHFVAMLAFMPGLEVAYDMRLTALSILVSSGGTLAALLVWQARINRPACIAAGGILLGLAVSGMHYLGVAAMSVSGLIEYDGDLVLASIAICAMLATTALARAGDLTGGVRRAEVAVWLACAVCSLHFVAMTGITFAPGPLIVASGGVFGTTSLAIAVAGVSVAILVASFVAAMIEQHLRHRAHHEAKVRHLANHDSLTRLPNRLCLQERLEAALGNAGGSGQGLAVIYLDLDRFKDVNDLHGHAAGDELLVRAAQRMLVELSPTDTLARIGGDEFVMILIGDPQPDKASIVTERIVAALREPFYIEGKRIEVGVSAGVALHPDNGTTAEALTRAADAAMYRAKLEGRGTWRFYDASISEQQRARLQLEQELVLAIERNELILHYQPVVNGATGEVETFEALIRWNHPVHGLILPAEFIPLAEATGLIDPIGQWVIETAFREAAAWGHPWRVSINVSPRQFRMSDLCALIAEALHRHALAPERVVVEVTESVLIDDAAKAVAMLGRLRQLGIRIALDDFGTGFSSLSYLQLFRFDKFKIDKSFVQKLEQGGDALTLTRTIVNLGHSLGLQVTAEGVETRKQLAMLRSLGCDQIQGYIVAKPAPIEAFTAADLRRIEALFGFATEARVA